MKETEIKDQYILDTTLLCDFDKELFIEVLAELNRIGCSVTPTI